MKPIVLLIVGVALAVAGDALVMSNAALHQPLGFWLWFGGLAAFSPAVGIWMYRRLKAREKQNTQ